MSESLCSSIQEGKEAEMKKLKHDFKATPLPAFYRGQKVSKSRAEKVCVDVIWYLLCQQQGEGQV